MLLWIIFLTPQNWIECGLHLVTEHAYSLVFSGLCLRNCFYCLLLWKLLNLKIACFLGKNSSFYVINWCEAKWRPQGEGYSKTCGQAPESKVSPPQFYSWLCMSINILGSTHWLTRWYPNSFKLRTSLILCSLKQEHECNHQYIKAYRGSLCFFLCFSWILISVATAY